MDISNAVWNEDDNSNTTAAPDGAPEGMAPSGVNNVLRAHQGAIKRWYDWTIPKTTGGSATAFTLSYSVAPGALVDGMTHLMQVNAVNGANPTLNVNSLGAIPLHFYCGGSWAALPANMLAADQIVEVTYNSAAGTYRCIGLAPVLTQSVSAAAAVDFTGIPSNVRNLIVTFDLTAATNAVDLYMRFYGSGGALDSGSNYSAANIAWATDSSGPTVSTSASLVTVITLANNVSNSANIGVSGDITIANIQAAKHTQVNYRTSFLSASGALGVSLVGGGRHAVAASITGLRIVPSAGNITGKVTVEMRS